MNAHPLDPMIYSPARETLLDLRQLQDDWDDMADIDATSLIGRLEAAHAAAMWFWFGLAVTLGLSLPIVASIALTRAFA